MPLDIDRIRRDTPAASQVIHLDNAGAALMPTPVVEAQIEHIKLEARLGGYRAAEVAADKIAGCRAAIGRLLNCQAGEVALVENATVGWNLAFHALDLGAGDQILTAEAEYASNYIAFLKLARDRGVETRVVPSDESGQLDVAQLQVMISPKVKLIAVTHVPTNGGLVNPAEAIGRVARASGVPFLLDACQSAGQLPLDVEALGCDFLSASGRKFLRGPRGSGFLYVRQDRLEDLEPPWPDLHSARWVAADRYELVPDARRFENWEFNYAAVIGLGVAVDYALDWGIEAIEAQTTQLAERLRQGLAAHPGVGVEDLGARRCGIVSLSLEGHDLEQIRERLTAEAINVTLSTPDSTRIDMDRRGLGSLLRVSPHYYNTEDEIDRFITVLERLLGATP